MMPFGLEKDILMSAPQSVDYNGVTYPIALEKARFADIEYLLKIRPIVVTMNIYGDRDRGYRHTPTNFYNRCYFNRDRDIYYENIMRMTAQMSLNFHVARTDKTDYDQILDTAVNNYLWWQMDGLRNFVEVIGQPTAVSDRSNLERGLVRKQFEIPIGYQFTAPLKRVTTIDFIEGEVVVDTEVDGKFFMDTAPHYF